MMEPLPRYSMGPAYRQLRTALESHRASLTPRQIQFVVLSLDVFPIARNLKLWSESVEIHRAEVDELPEALRRPFRECEAEVTSRIQRQQLAAKAEAAASPKAAPGRARSPQRQAANPGSLV